MSWLDDPLEKEAWRDLWAAKRDPELFWKFVSTYGQGLSERERTVLLLLYPPDGSLPAKKPDILAAIGMRDSMLTRIIGGAERELIRQRFAALAVALPDNPIYKRGYAAGYAAGRQELLNGLAGLFGQMAPEEP